MWALCADIIKKSQKKKQKNNESHKEHISRWVRHILFCVMVFFLSHMKVSLSHFTIIYNRHLDSLNRHCIAIFLSSFGECYIL